MSKFMSCDFSFEDAKTVLFGVGFDGTVTNRPGTRFAPQQIRPESYGLEDYSPYFDKEIKDCLVCDDGDLELPFGDTEMALNTIQGYVENLVDNNKKPLMIGGEHLVTLPVIKALSEKYRDLCIIHFDAHCDLREEYLGVKLSHSTVLNHCHKLLGDNRIFQFGIRSGTKEEFSFAKSGHTFLQKYNFDGLLDVVKVLADKPIYFTLDLDVLDPSIFPGTGTPEPGGVTFKELLDAFKILNGLNIIGADVLELSPHYDQSGVSTAVACKAIREIMCLLSFK